jgi:hypothetical protein
VTAVERRQVIDIPPVRPAHQLLTLACGCGCETKAQAPDVAVVVDIGEYRRLTRPAVDLASVLLGGPKLDDDTADVFAEIEAERKADFGRAVDLEAGT